MRSTTRSHGLPPAILDERGLTGRIGPIAAGSFPRRGRPQPAGGVIRRDVPGATLALMLPALAPLALSVALGPAPAVWPLQPAPEVVTSFQAPEHPWGPGHRGADLLGWPGQPVHSAADGVVSFAGRVAGRGVVVVTQGGRRTTYEPVDPDVRAGTTVVAGQVLGALEVAGSHCVPRACLHWGLIEGRTYRDPLSLIGCRPQPVRLLPLDQAAPPSARDCAEPATWGHRLADALLRLAGVLAGRPGAAGRS